MSIPLTINAVIDDLAELEGQAVVVEGLLNFEFEDMSLWHWPKREQRDTSVLGARSSSLWLSFGSGSFQPNERSFRAGMESVFASPACFEAQRQNMGVAISVGGQVKYSPIQLSALNSHFEVCRK